MQINVDWLIVDNNNMFDCLTFVLVLLRLFSVLVFCVAIWVAPDFTSPVGFYKVTFAHFDVILFAI